MARVVIENLCKVFDRIHAIECVFKISAVSHYPMIGQQQRIVILNIRPQLIGQFRSAGSAVFRQGNASQRQDDFRY